MPTFLSWRSADYRAGGMFSAPHSFGERGAGIGRRHSAAAGEAVGSNAGPKGTQLRQLSNQVICLLLFA
jgi:hypothetical protein